MPLDQQDRSDPVDLQESVDLPEKQVVPENLDLPDLVVHLDREESVDHLEKADRLDLPDLPAPEVAEDLLASLVNPDPRVLPVDSDLLVHLENVVNKEKEASLANKADLVPQDPEVK